MKNKILSKIMIAVLMISSISLFTACKSYQKEVNITSIEVKEDSVPTAIEAGQFDDAGITLIINYEDGTDEEMSVTSELIPEEYQEHLSTPGVYVITILFKGFETKITVTIVEVIDTFTVNFYDAYGEVISTQQVEKGKDAVAPSESESSIEGYEFVDWDRKFTNITENTNVYGIYANIEILFDDSEALQKLKNAEQYFINNNHIITGTYVHESLPEETFEIIYHYDTSSQKSESQTVETSSDLIVVSNYFSDKVEFYIKHIRDGERVDEEYIDYTNDFNQDPDDMKLMYILFGGKNIRLSDEYIAISEETKYKIKVSQSGKFYEYTFLCSEGSGDYTKEIVFTYDDEKLLAINIKYYDNTSSSPELMWKEDLNISYSYADFDETLIPESVKNSSN